MQAMNQISGINITSYYMSYVFINALNLDELLARILAAAGSVDYLIFSFLAYFVIERYGRRKVMMTSALACSLCWVVIAIALSISDTGRGDKYKLGIVAVSFFFVSPLKRLKRVKPSRGTLIDFFVLSDISRSSLLRSPWVY